MVALRVLRWEEDFLGETTTELYSGTHWANAAPLGDFRVAGSSRLLFEWFSRIVYGNASMCPSQG